LILGEPPLQPAIDTPVVSAIAYTLNRVLCMISLLDELGADYYGRRAMEHALFVSRSGHDQEKRSHLYTVHRRSVAVH
jgi:hypothetical protein